MNANDQERVTEVWLEVQNWPMRSQVSLASRILQSVEQAIDEPLSHRSQSLRALIGILEMDPVPTDSDIRQIVSEERQRKYG